MKAHVKEYKELMDKYMDLSKDWDFKDRTSVEYLTMRLIGNRLDEIRKRHTQFTVHCIKECYVGQGMYFDPGQTVTEYIDEEEAKDHVGRCNSDPWAKGCFDLGVRCQNESCGRSVSKITAHYDKYADVYICSECKDKHGYI